MPLQKIFKDLDVQLVSENTQLRTDGFPGIRSCEFRLLGQSALLEAKLKLHLNATTDIDAYTNADWYVIERLGELLQNEGLHFDTLSKEIWMPEETTYTELFNGQVVNLLCADPVFVMVSKALKAPRRNLQLIADYIAQDPASEFFPLCSKYQIILEDVLNGLVEDL